MECGKCSGTGRQLEHRSRWIGGGKSGYRSEWDIAVTCETCGGTGQLPEPEGPPPAAAVVYCGAVLEAPGFTSETFTAALHRARTRGTMPMIGAGAGVVLVESVRSGARYRVTRETCSCQGSQSHGVCMHRAAVIAAHDLYGVDVCRGHVLGFDAHGHITTAADRVAQLEGQAVA